jgi:CRP/FNR family transcriptional regulator, cyclic AMP receptor protein
MNEIDGFLRQISIFSQLSDEKLGQISNLSIRQKYNKDSIILFEHETGSIFFIVIKGKVKLSRTSEDGNEVILTTLSESDFFGEMSLLDGSSRSANVTATEDSELLIIKRKEFVNLLHSDPDISIALLIELTQKLRTANLKLKSLSLKDAEGKVAVVILQLADDIGKIRQGTVEIERLPFQHDLANMAGTSRETISRTLHTFAKKGLVELDGSRLRILNYEKFKELFN